MKNNHSNIDLPFSIICSRSSGSSGYDFMVNFGSINDFIFSTYKRLAKPFSPLFSEDLITTEAEAEYSFIEAILYLESVGIINSSARYGDTFIYKLSKKLQKTFTVHNSCSVYLTIPKIPAGFDYKNEGNAKNKWWLKDRVNFLNQFTIEISGTEGFDKKLTANNKSIEKKNPFAKDGGGNIPLNQNLNDREYPGKFYIKLADIIIENNSYKINYFCRSDFIAPIRWISLTGPQRAFRLVAQFCSIDRKNGETRWLTGTTAVNHPDLLLETSSSLKNVAETKLGALISKTLEIKEFSIVGEIIVHRIFLVYLEKTEAETVIEVLKDDFEGHNKLLVKLKRALEDEFLQKVDQAYFFVPASIQKITESDVKSLFKLQGGSSEAEGGPKETVKIIIPE